MTSLFRLACLGCALVVGAEASARQTVSAFPFYENFEASPGAFVPAGINTTWEWAAPATNLLFEPYGGQRSWVTNANGPHAPDEFSFLESPLFDFTSATVDPTLRFAHAFRLSTQDEHWVELSLDGGPYQRLGFSSADAGAWEWYNDAPNRWWDGDSGPNRNWRLARHPLTGAAGHTARVRWVLRADPFTEYREEGVALDDVLVYETLVDLAPTAVAAPVGGARLGASEAVTLEVTNLGSEAVNSFVVDVDVVGPLPQSFQELVTIAVPSGGMVEVTLSSTLDLSVVGSYELTATVSAPGEQLTANDAVEVPVVHQPVVTQLPYVAGLEADDGAFVVGGPLASWVHAATDLGANTGTRAWVTGLSGPTILGEDSYLQLPPVDLTALAFDPVLELALDVDQQGFEGLWVEFSLDGGPFAKLGEWDDDGSVNWYTDSSDTWRFTNGWTVASHSLDGCAGHELVLRIYAEMDPTDVRRGGAIDDIRIEEGAYGDGQVPQFGRAVLSTPGAVDGLGESTASGHPGPYVVEVSAAGGLLTLQFEGEPNQPISLFTGPIATNTFVVPGAGQVDLGAGTMLIASGYLPGGLNPFFFTGPAGTQTVGLTVPQTLVGTTLGLQALVDRAGPAFALSNALEVTIVP